MLNYSELMARTMPRAAMADNNQFEAPSMVSVYSYGGVGWRGPRGKASDRTR